MNTRLRNLFVIVSLLFSANAMAQQSTVRPVHSAASSMIARHQTSGEDAIAIEAREALKSFYQNPLPQSIVLPGATTTPVGGKYDRQTNGRALHNIAVDPDNTQNIHAVIMSAPGTAADTVGGAFPGRRCYYIFSADGGTTWSTPVVVGGLRLGYPDLALWKRGSVWVPIIAAHRYVTGSTTNFQVAIFVEKGAPGAGNFGEIDAATKASNGATESLAWPTIAVSNGGTGSTVYIVADYSSATVGVEGNFEFGTYSLNADGTGKFNGWLNEPGAADAGHADSTGVGFNGEHILRVASDGTIGILWINPYNSIGDHNLYFTQSHDGGNTWDTVSAVFPATFDNVNFRGIAADYGLDFFYKKTTPYFTWQGDDMIQGENANTDADAVDTNGTYYPYTSQLFFWTLGRPVQVLNYSPSPAYNVLRTTQLGTIDTVYYLNQAPYIQDFTTISAGSSPALEFPDPAFIAYPTFALSSDSNSYSIYYQTLQESDTELVTGFDGTQYYAWYSSIYYQNTTDDGQTWSVPRAYLANTVGTPPYYDYRYPNVALNNPTTESKVSNRTLTAVDSLAGTITAADNYASWDSVFWVFKIGTATEAVHATHTDVVAQMQSYPNPFSQHSTIAFTLANAAVVDLEITDVLGRSVTKLVTSERMSAGAHSVRFNGSNLPNGVYFSTLRAGGQSFTERMVVAR